MAQPPLPAPSLVHAPMPAEPRTAQAESAAAAGPSLYLGATRPIDGSTGAVSLRIAPSDLLTHGVLVGMTGSGKTGLLMVMVEEALSAGVPVLMLDIKGDLPNLGLLLPELAPEQFLPWLDEHAGVEQRIAEARTLSEASRARLGAWGLEPSAPVQLAGRIALRVFTPASSAGEPLHVLSFLETPSPLWQSDIEAAREALSASVSLLLRLIGRDPDPTKSRDHVVLSVLAERRLRAGQSAEVARLLDDVREPPIEQLGAMPVDQYLPKRDRLALATALNTLLASPTFETWRTGAPLDVASWLSPRPDGRTQATVLSVAHLDDDERQLVLGVVLEQVVAWMRTLSGTSRLRALVVIDEAFGILPPHPASPPTKRPAVTLLKQGRAFGLGVLIATQNPMDLDYRALSNAGLWAIGRLQTDADRQRVVDAISGDSRTSASLAPLSDSIKQLSHRWFVLRNVHRAPALQLLQSRSTLCWLRGPMTRADLRRLRRQGG